MNFKLKFFFFFFFSFLRFSFDKDVNLGLQFVIGLLITSLACEFSWIILSPNHPIKGKKKKTRFGRIGRILYDSTILYDPTRSYHFYDPTTILNVLVRRDSKIMRSYNLNHDFDNYG